MHHSHHILITRGVCGSTGGDALLGCGLLKSLTAGTDSILLPHSSQGPTHKLPWKQQRFSLLLHHCTECKTMQVPRLLIGWWMRSGAGTLPQPTWGAQQQGWRLCRPGRAPCTCTHSGPLSFPLQAGHINQTSGMLRSKSVTLLPPKITLHKPLELTNSRSKFSFNSFDLARSSFGG